MASTPPPKPIRTAEMAQQRHSDADADDVESLLSHSDDSEKTRARRIQRNSSERSPRYSWPEIAALTVSHLLLSAIVLGIYVFVFPNTPKNLDQTCARWTTHPSSVTKDVQIKYNMVQYNGSFFHQTVYRDDPSPRVDDAWEALGVDYRALKIPDEEAELSGISKKHVRINPKYGGGYPANVEGLHHLHCLNLLRQGLYYNYNYYKELKKGAFKNQEPIVKVHITHCLDILRQQLMCTADTGVLGQVWWNPKAPEAFVDFNTKHRCKNYEAIRQWAEVRQLPKDPPKDYILNPTGDQILSEIP